MKRIIVTRFSAMGDVAMLASVITEFQEAHKDTEIIMVSRKFLKDFFHNIPRLIFHEIEPKSKHKGFLGLYRLYRELRLYNPHYIADLHNNLRSRVLDFFFNACGKSVTVLDKGRAEKKDLLKKRIPHPLKLTTERYADVFRKLGFTLTLSHQLSHIQRPIPNELGNIFLQPNKKVGIAPFAQHPYKVWPLTKMEEVISYLSSRGYAVFLFGGGANERALSEKWAQNYSGVYNTIGRYTIESEMNIIAQLDLMISMDSSGMHMASLAGIRCLSIWGATHPYAGFLGYGQSYEDCIQVDHPNRPSSIYGNKPCDCGGTEAIDLVTSKMVINRIKQICE